MRARIILVISKQCCRINKYYAYAYAYAFAYAYALSYSCCPHMPCAKKPESLMMPAASSVRMSMYVRYKRKR